MITLRCPDGIVRKIDPAQLKEYFVSSSGIALKIGGSLCDFSSCPESPGDSEVEIVTTSSPGGMDIYRHSASHIMAHAVKDLFPDARVTIGPSIEDGFYYDFDNPQPFTPEDISKIEKRMEHIIRQNNPFIRRNVPKDEAIRIFEEQGEFYKVEILKEINDETVSLYDEGGFLDLCRGPHLPSTGRVKAFRLLNVAGAYWRGDEKNRMLQRIYGTAFGNAEDLKKYLDFLEEVKKRDHRKLGRELDLFSISDSIGAGLILWHPAGAIIRKTIEDFWRDEHIRADYKILYTPHIAKLDLWKQSGHLDFYRENMYSPMDIDEVAYELKPMNCPFHVGIYASSLKSYRELPVRYAELGTVYRYERSGVLHGLMRVRGFTQDDAHIFCREDQIEEEILTILEFTLFILRTFGFDSYDVYLSTRPEKYVGTPENWERSTNALKNALEKKGISYKIDPGEGVFYGPKIDIKIKDSLHRSWQCSTIQVDFNNPERFELNYRGADGKEHRPIMIHRALMGSLERFFGILIEHYAGVFPLWLAPVQTAVLTIAERHADYAMAVHDRLRSAGIRSEIHAENEKIGYKIRQATVRKIPYLIIIGDREAEDRTVTVRKRTGEQVGPQHIEAFIHLLKEEIIRKV